MSFDTPLRYPGGKGRLTQYMGQIIELNDLADGQYIEPYAGGAGIAISLLFLEYVSRIHLNDISYPIYCFWKSVVDRPDELCKCIFDTEVTIDEWRRQREIQRNLNLEDLVTIGFSTFFLNRTNRSGIISGGVIGGQDQSGKWKLNARYNKEELVRRIERISSYKDRISISNMDAAEYITEYIGKLNGKAIVYIDPPYYIKGRGLYENHYDHKDHVKICGLVTSKIKQNWIVSYDNVDQIRHLYENYRQEVFGLRYSANNKFMGSEVMIFKDGLTIPERIEPSRGDAA